MSNFEFEYPWVLGIAAALGVLLVYRAWRRRSPAMAYGRVDLAEGLPATPRLLLRHAGTVARTLAFVALALACARPQLEEFDRGGVEGIDIFLVLDMSGSMQGVDLSAGEIRAFQRRFQEDPPNRFDQAIATLKRFVDGRERDRIGMVVFAREAYLQFPLTLDYSTIQTLLDQLEIHAIDASQTAIGNALGLSVRGLLDSEASSRAVILITDGKQQGGNISPVAAAELAADEGMKLYTILVGREGPTMAPTSLVRSDGTRAFQQQDFAVDPELLRRIAEITDGQFYRSTNAADLERDLNAILDDLETTEMDDVTSVREREIFAGFALVALLLLLLDGLLSHLFVRRFP